MKRIGFIFAFSLLILSGFVLAEDSKTLGKSEAPVAIEFYTDFQCPFCSNWYFQTLPLIKENYIDEGIVKLIVYHFPLFLLTDGFHTDSLNASIAAECAAKQGKFFDYIGLLFKSQTALKYENLKEYASTLDLDA